MKFIHAADVHLDSPLLGLERYEGAPVDEVRGATRRAFQNLVDLALAESVDLVLLAGDLYDGDWRDYNTGLFFTGQIARLGRAGIRACLVAGNHDAASRLTRLLRPPENLHVFPTSAPGTLLLEDLGVAVHGQGFATRSVSRDLSRDYPLGDPALFNIGLLHTSLDGRPGHDAYAPCTLDGLRSRGYQYWALGHVHAREVACEDPWVVFPGNIQGRNVRESGPKGCTLVTVEEGEVSALEHRDLDVLRWFRRELDLTGVRDLDEVYPRVGDELASVGEEAEGRLAAVRLELTGACAVHDILRCDRERVVNECRALAGVAAGGDLWLEKVAVHTRRADSDASPIDRDDAFGDLLRTIGDWELDEERGDRLAAEVADLLDRLPAELRTGPDAFDPSDPALQREALEDVKALLLARLIGSGDDG